GEKPSISSHSKLSTPSHCCKTDKPNGILGTVVRPPPCPPAADKEPHARPPRCHVPPLPTPLPAAAVRPADPDRPGPARAAHPPAVARQPGPAPPAVRAPGRGALQPPGGTPAGAPARPRQRAPLLRKLGRSDPQRVRAVRPS